MASGFDRLERLFSVRKNKDGSGSRLPRSSMLLSHRRSMLFSSSSNASSMTSSSSTPHFSTSPTSSSLDDLHFPSPSFIRPKASRMQPREDTALTDPKRKNSVLITSTSHIRLAAPTSPISPQKSSNRGSPIRPPRSPPLPPSPPHSHGTTAPTTTAISPLLQRRDRSLIPLATPSVSNFAQPAPSKVQQASLQLQQQLGQIAEVESLPLLEESTTESTEATEPVESADSLARTSSQATLIASHDQASPKSDIEPETPADETVEVPIKAPIQRSNSVVAPIVLPRKLAAEEIGPASPFRFRSNFAAQRRRVRVRQPLSLRYQRHLPSTSRPSLSSGAVLLEPDLGEFLALSDDDIAEETDKATTVETKTEELKEKKEEARPTPTTTTTNVAKTAKASKKLQKPLPPLLSKQASVPSLSHAAATAASASRSAPTTPTSSRFRLSESTLPPAVPAPVTPASPTPPLTPLGTRPRTPVGHARMAAAFEMARIASQYSFDLAYIARIWPKHRSAGPPVAFHKSQPSSASSRCSYNSTSTASTDATAVSAGRRPSTASSTSTASSSTSTSTFTSSGSPSPRLAAQFLAAYGLATVAAPYSLSAPMHAKILRAKENQWLSFHEPEARPGEFYRGYGCAFGDGGSDETDDSGIVFVAYQRRTAAAAADGQGNNDSDAAVLPAADLDELRQAVAALVGRLLAVHLQQEQQQQQQAKAAVTARGQHDVTCTLRRSRFLGVRATA